MTRTIHPIRLLAIGGPEAAGGGDLLARATTAARAGADVDVLLSGAGLRWLEDARLAELARREGIGVALCSRSARDAGLDPASIPPWVRWSSLLRWLLDRPEDARLWGLMP